LDPLGVRVVVPESRHDEAVTEAYSTRHGIIGSKSSFPCHRSFLDSQGRESKRRSGNRVRLAGHVSAHAVLLYDCETLCLPRAWRYKGKPVTNARTSLLRTALTRALEDRLLAAKMTAYFDMQTFNERFGVACVMVGGNRIIDRATT